MAINTLSDAEIAIISKYKDDLIDNNLDQFFHHFYDDLEWSGNKMAHIFNYMYYHIPNLLSYLSYVPSLAFSSGDKPFKYDKIEIPNNVIGSEEYAFYSVIAREIILPDTWRVIPRYSFQNAIITEKFNLPSNLNVICKYAFCNVSLDGNVHSENPHLQYLFIPDSIQDFEQESFADNPFLVLQYNKQNETLHNLLNNYCASDVYAIEGV